MVFLVATIFMLCVTIYFYKHIDANSYLKRLSPEVKAKWLAKSNSNCEKDVNCDQD